MKLNEMEQKRLYEYLSNKKLKRKSRFLYMVGVFGLFVMFEVVLFSLCYFGWKDSSTTEWLNAFTALSVIAWCVFMIIEIFILLGRGQ